MSSSSSSFCFLSIGLLVLAPITFTNNIIAITTLAPPTCSCAAPSCASSPCKTQEQKQEVVGRCVYYLDDGDSFPIPAPMQRFRRLGAIILPRITHFEAREKYCVQHARLRSYRTNLTLPVQASLTFGRTHLYKEQNIVVLARRMYGADVEIANARKVFVQPGDKVRQVPLEPIRERRNFIRQAFWEFGIFAALEQSLVHRFVEYIERDLHQLVSRFCC
ncbi:hypothetical protein K457DRAFT_23392 [Linnemannia elongata AG-77]|uniref:Uncharacterized protein n=1 Tax=Linnemannia elongata AG-77 TaxID=1314771 RepID=A0A197JJ27_9FUNG|nr:hypothetical protein K457DRAFT_23392 [Linnemannia elongata AG-77]